MGKGDTLLNAVIGAVVTWVASPVLSVVPIIGTLLGPVAGGATATYLQESDDNGVSLKIGAISGAIASVPLILLGVAFLVFFGSASVSSEMPMGIAGLGSGIILIFFLVAVAFTVGLSALGGLVGQYVREEY